MIILHNLHTSVVYQLRSAKCFLEQTLQTKNLKKILPHLKHTLWREAISKTLLTLSEVFTLRSKISRKDTSPPPMKKKQRSKQILPFITLYHPAVRNLKEILTKVVPNTAKICHCCIPNFQGVAHNIIILKGALTQRCTCKSKIITKVRKPNHIIPESCRPVNPY